MKVQIKNLVKQFSDFKAVDNMNIEMKDGELISLLGPSGCGKTTTLNMLAGILEVTEGQILFGDRDVTEVEPQHRGIGIVFQNYALYPHMTVRDNIAFPLKAKGIKKAERYEEAKKFAALVKLDHLLDRKPGELSGGQQQRVAIARALVKKPDILLLDEPLSNLDAKLRVETREEIRRIQQQVGITAVFVTHDQEEAMSISDTIVVMNKGHIQQAGEPQDIYVDPANLFVAKFMGTPEINLINAVVVDEDTVQSKDGAVTIKCKSGKTAGHEVVVGIRAENFLVGEKTTNMISGEVIAVEIKGRDKKIDVQVGEKKVAVLVPIEQNIATGEKVELGINDKGILLFDKETEERIQLG